jgi:hypothetical protein
MGEGDFRKEIGNPLVIVTTHGGACKLCTRWQGKILIDDVYSGGTEKDGDYTLLSDAMEQGFLHPNCRHGLSTYYPELEGIKYDEEETDEEIDDNLRDKLNYYDRQEQANIRKSKGFIDRDNVKSAKKEIMACEKEKGELVIQYSYKKETLNYLENNINNIEAYVSNSESLDVNSKYKESLKFVIKDKKVDNLPKIIDEKTYEEISLNDNSKILWRGFYDDKYIQKNVDKYIREFKTEDVRFGNGDIRFGAGYNFTSDYDIARSFAFPYDENVIEVILSPKANLIEYEELKNKMKYIFKDSKYPSYVRKNPSLVAAILGFDGISNTRNEVYVIINRGVLYLKE